MNRTPVGIAVCFATTVLSSLVLLSCSKRISDRNVPFCEIIPDADTSRLTLPFEKRNPIRIVYMGCGHLMISYKGENIIIDPFISTSGFTDKFVRSDTLALENYKSILTKHQFNIAAPTSVWISHSHYDHMMDIPLFIKEDILGKSSTFYGSDMASRILANFKLNDRYHILDKHQVFHPTKNDTAVHWIPPTNSIRALAIESDHASHYKLGPVKIHLMKGDLDDDYFLQHYTDPLAITKRNQWKEGETYSFLVDFMDEGKIEYRFFIQTSGSLFPKGRPPIPLPDGRSVDVAFLCLASANYVSPYPVNILKELKPVKTVFIHWEDFFRAPLDHEGARLVRFTNFRKVNRRLKRNGHQPTSANSLMPRPGTLIVVEGVKE